MLHGAGVSFTPWGIAIVKAFVLAKFMLIGRAMKIGERYTTQPLIWPTLHKSFAFLVLLVVLTIIEEVVVGLFHQQSVAASLGELTGAKLYETLAGYIIMLLVLIPYIAWGVLDEALGEGRLTRMFFVDRGWATSSTTSRAPIVSATRMSVSGCRSMRLPGDPNHMLAWTPS